MTITTGCNYIDDYAAAVRSGQRRANSKIRKALDLAERKLSEPGVIVDAAMTERAKELIEKYFEITLFDWQLFVLGLVHCYYPDDSLVFDEFLLEVGRGNGKNGFISGLAWYLTTPDHGIRGYNVDIIANSEDQAKTSFDDIYEMLGRFWGKLNRFYYRSKELIQCVKTGSYIKFNTSNAKTKDGKRSACLVFDEVHEYENDDSIRVFKSGFGKRRHSRIFEITTQGYVRGGVLDARLEIANAVLNGEHPESRLYPLLYELEDEANVGDEDAWIEANPSLPYLPVLRRQIEKENLQRVYDKSVELDFWTKRMNRPRSNMEIAVTEWANIEATNRPLPEDMQGWQCTVGIDYASMRDWASVNLHFKRGEQRYDISRSWVCTKNPELFRVKAPWQRWEEVTPVDEVEIAPELLAEYIAQAGRKYNIAGIALDNFRYALMKKALEAVGFDAVERKNIVLIRPSNIMRVQPIIASLFLRQLMSWGDTPSLRWAANNTKLVRAGKKDGTDTGNYYYAKIEGRSRKTDPFMALVASVCIEDLIPEPVPDWFKLEIIT